MTAPVNFAADCLHAWELMPAIVLGDAPQAQVEWLERHLAQCVSCRAEFAQQRCLRRALSLPAEVGIDADVGFRRLLARIDTPESAAVRPPSRFVRILVAAVLLQAVGMGVLGVHWWRTSVDAPYSTLSRESPSTFAAAIRLVPDARMSLAEWNDLLQREHLQIVAGPNSVGAYTVASANTAGASAQMLARLRALPGVRLAEPVGAQP